MRRAQGETVPQHGVGPSVPSTGITRWLPLVIAIASPASSTTIVVPTDRPTIQSAVDSAGADDIISVEAGTYAENVRIGAGRHGLTIVAADDLDPPSLVGTRG